MGLPSSSGAKPRMSALVGETATITVTGELNVRTMPELNQVVTDFFASPDNAGTELLTLDLSTVSSCDRAAVEAVWHARAVCARNSAALRLVPSEPIRRALTAKSA